MLWDRAEKEVKQLRIVYAMGACATIVLGLLVHWQQVLGGAAQDFSGDALWALMIAAWVSAAAPAASRVSRCTVALVICFAVELSQLSHAPTLAALRATTVGRLVLGSGFDARDLVAYLLGVVVFWMVDFKARADDFFRSRHRVRN